MSATLVNDYAVEIVGLTKRFGAAEAVHDLSFHLPAGSIFGFLGPNGAGKTTTIRMLLGLTRPDAGSALILGLDTRSQISQIKQRVGYVPEGHYIHRWMRVGEAIGFCRRLYRTWNDQRCDELLCLLQLDARKRVKQLSKGMLTKLSLLLALAHDPEVLILDEPTSGLDPIIREEFLDCVLRTVCERRQTVIFSSHTLSDVQRLADRVGILCDGVLLVDCQVDELLTSTKRLRVILRDGGEAVSAPRGMIWQRRQRREWLITVRSFCEETLHALRRCDAIENVEVMDIGLEEIFKDFVKGRKEVSAATAGVLI